MIKRHRLLRRAIEALEPRRLFAVGPDGFGYTADAHAYEALDLIPGAAGVVSLIDSALDASATVPLGSNSFSFYGTTYTGSNQLFVNTHGLITFASGTTAYSNTDLTTSPTQRSIAPLWDDFTTATVTTTAGATNDVVLYQIDSANNRLIIEWNAARHNSSTGTGDGTFQAILQLNTGASAGAIVFNYKDLDFGNAAYNNGASATVGIKDAATQGANRLLVSQNNGANVLLGNSKAVRIAAGSGSITGTKFEDRNANGARDAGEPGLGGWTIYIDANDNGQLDAGESSTVTDGSGNYAFNSVTTGTRILREVPQAGWIQTAPLVSGQSSGSASLASATEDDADQFGVIAGREFTRTEVIVAAPGRDALANLKKSLGGGTSALRELLDLDHSKTLSRGRKQSMLELKLKPGADVLAAVALLNRTAGVEWAAPNYVYAGPDPRELTPNDPSYGSQWFHPKMQNNLAWDTTQGEGVVVAVTDDGTDWDHVDLAANIWANADEVAGNGVDDDLNGFIDDVRGWDFISNDNNPDHVGTDSHGTHVAGIIAARTNNAVGIAGTAGRVQLMPVRFYGSTSAWTSTHVFNAYKYAVDNGAKIVSTSYNVDGFVGDPTFVSALNYVYNAGALHFNSAGNSGALNPPRQVYDQSLYVASTNSSDVRSSFSNYGTGIDIAAPGETIYSTLPNNTYGNNSGTSMATPNAAAAAALIWAAQPTWSRDQVAAQLLGAADNIDGLNPSYATLLGTGRVNSFKGVTNTLAAPKFRGVTGLPTDNASITSGPTAVTFDLFNVLDASAMNAVANFELRSDGIDDVFGNGDDAIVPLSLGATYRVGTNKFTVTIGGGSLPSERYRFRAISGAGALRDPFGTPLDGNGDGVGGDAFSRTFTIIPKTAARVVNVALNTTTPDVTFGDFPTVFTGGGGANSYVLTGDAGDNIDLWVDQDPQVTPNPTYTIARSRLTTLTLNGGGGDDALRLDYSFGNPIPVGGIAFDGGAGASDAVTVRGTAGNDVFAFDATAIHRTGNAPVTRSGVEKVLLVGTGGNDDVSVGGAGTVVEVPAAQRLASLNVAAGGTVRVTPGGTQPFVLGALTVDGTLDLADNDLVVDYAGQSVLGTSNGSTYNGVTGRIATGAIVSSIAAAGVTGLGVAEAAAVLSFVGPTTTWGGVTVDTSAVLVKFTYLGDANLDGLVSGDDYAAIDFNIAVLGAAGWSNGDFNLDGIISGDDYAAIDFTIAAQGAPL